MRRSAQDVLEAMGAVAGQDSEARDLVRDFTYRARFGEWLDRDPLPQDDEEFILDEDEAVSAGHVPLFLTSSIGLGRPKDPIVWTDKVRNGEDGELVHAIFVDATPCHRDWLGLKVISEFSFVLSAWQVEEMVHRLEPSLIPEDLDPDVVLYRALDHLTAIRNAMIYRLVNNKLGGRLRDRAKIFAGDPRLPAQKMAEHLTKETLGLHTHSWPRPANKYENQVRTEISAYAARGAIVSVGTRQNLVPS